MVTLIGTIAIDALMQNSINDTLAKVEIRYGGVCCNSACVLGNAGIPTKFITQKYFGDFGNNVINYLNENNVLWSPLDNDSYMPFFQAFLNHEGICYNELFIENDSLKYFTPENIKIIEHEISPGIIFTCTDLRLDALLELQNIAIKNGSELWVLVSYKDAGKHLLNDNLRPNGIGLNIIELEYTFDAKYNNNHKSIAFDALKLIKDFGFCLVTLGDKGMIAVIKDKKGNKYGLYQSVPSLNGFVTIGAGDYLFATILSNYIKTFTWPTALHKAAISTHFYILNNRINRFSYSENEIASANFERPIDLNL